MQQIIRLYYPEDIDLIAIRFKLGKKFGEIVKKAIYSMIKGIEYTIPVQDSVRRYAKKLKKPIAVKILINEETEKEIFDYIKSLPFRSRTGTIKNIIRGSYDRFPIGLFNLSSKKNDIFIQKSNTVSLDNKTDSEKNDIDNNDDIHDINEVKQINSESHVIKEESVKTKNKKKKVTEKKKEDSNIKEETNNIDPEPKETNENKETEGRKTESEKEIERSDSKKEQDEDSFDTLFNMAF